MTTTGVPQDMVTLVRHTPVWAEYEALAPTLAYDFALLGDGTVPRARLEGVRTPTLVLDGAASPELLRCPSRIVRSTTGWRPGRVRRPRPPRQAW
ncbi:hypothetical protein KV100_07065 [Mumia sp. zg.B21]|uniref:hypothetical protein n=1 Tax=Mumia sp. zg.B21 TaxID=2855447 RepID=UPI001C6EA3C1|nr:hypothetical protein [Mumia sp. zg.B21]MBW9209411.1 hypothetical protein [Mumia sp. zg.B21]